MSNERNLSNIFDVNALLYDKFRPGYPEELYKYIFDYVTINENSNVVEVGSGSGQATKPFLETGCKLTAIEYGQNFSKILKEKYNQYNKFDVCTSKFEETAFPKNTYDLVFSATAFHWIPEQIGYNKLFDMLKSKGVFARFANHPYIAEDNPELFQKIQALYKKYYYSFYGKEQSIPQKYYEEDAQRIAYIAEKYGFVGIQYALFCRKRVFSAEEYISLLHTYSDHMALEETIRNKFFDEIQETIEIHDGQITISDTIDLQLARKP